MRPSTVPMKILIRAFSFILLTCSTVAHSENEFQPAQSHEGEATIYIYRPDTYFNSAGWPNIYIDNQLKSSLDNNSYFSHQSTPGDHVIKAEGSTWGTNWYPNPVERTLKLEAGTLFFIRVRPIQTGTTAVQNGLTESAATNAILGAAIQSAIGNLSNVWPTAITLIEFVDEDTGILEIQEIHDLKEIEKKEAEREAERAAEDELFGND